MHERWTENPEWAAGRLRSETATSAILLALFALVWNAIAWGVTAVTWEEAWETIGRREPGPWLFWLFGGVGLVLAAFALRRLLIWWRFGTSVFVMRSVPGAIGGTLEGSIQTRIRVGDRPRSVGLSLECRRRESQESFGSAGKRDRETTTTTVWSSSVDVDPNQLGVGPEGFSIPVSFRIPDSCPPTDESDPDDEHYWRLSLHADLPGVDLETAWTVPVFRIEATPERDEGEWRRRSTARRSALAEFHPSQEEPVGFAEPVAVMRQPTGATEYHVRMESTPRQLFGAVAISSVAAVTLYAAQVRGWHVGFRWAAGLVLLLYLVGLALMFFWKGRIVLDGGEVRTSIRFLFFTFGRERIPCSEVAHVRASAAEGAERRGEKRPRWSVVIDRRGREPVDTGALLASRKVAEWLALEIEHYALRNRPIGRARDPADL
jgi:hypothetical protein